MTKLSKWFPFKFNRKPSKDAETPATQPPVHPMQRFFESMAPFERMWPGSTGMFAEMDRMFDDRFFGDFAPQNFQPSIDVIDEGKHLRVSAELPGLDRDDVELHVEDGMLVIKGEKKSETKNEEEGCYRLERYFGQFRRAVPLPADVDVSAAEANFDKGLLTVRLPKKDVEGGSKRIEVK